MGKLWNSAPRDKLRSFRTGGIHIYGPLSSKTTTVALVESMNLLFPLHKTVANVRWSSSRLSHGDVRKKMHPVWRPVWVVYFVASLSPNRALSDIPRSLHRPFIPAPIFFFFLIGARSKGWQFCGWPCWCYTKQQLLAVLSCLALSSVVRHLSSVLRTTRILLTPETP